MEVSRVRVWSPNMDAGSREGEVLEVSKERESMKQKCIKCNKEKDASEFDKTSTGSLLWCKACADGYGEPYYLRFSRYLINKYQRRTLYRCLKEEREKDK